VGGWRWVGGRASDFGRSATLGRGGGGHKVGNFGES
jgi:hypothetical protein